MKDTIEPSTEAPECFRDVAHPQALARALLAADGVNLETAPRKQRRVSMEEPTTEPRILIVDPDPTACAAIDSAFAAVGPARALALTNVKELQEECFRGNYDLVVCRSTLGGASAVEVLARARSLRRSTIFVIYSSLDQPWLRVFVSDGEASVLSSRVVSLDGLAQLAAGMLKSRRVPVA